MPGIPSFHAIAAMAVTIAMFVGFARGRLSVEIVSLLTIAAIAVGLYFFPLDGTSPTDGLALAFGGFGHYALITICALMIMGRGLVVTGALEVERREKRIGASLEAAPDVYIEDKALIDAFEGESPADIFITSGARLIEGSGPPDAYKLEDTPGVSVVPKKADGVKCARSWKYFDPATADPAFPDITPRDAEAVREMRGQD